MGADKPGTSCNDRFQTPPPFCAFTFKILSSLLLKLWFQDSMLKQTACSMVGKMVDAGPRSVLRSREAIARWPKRYSEECIKAFVPGSACCTG